MNPTEYPIRFSHLKQMGQSPAHYLYSLTSGIRQSSVMSVGKLVHCLVLGGSYVVYDKIRRGKAWAEFVLDHPTDFIVTKSELYGAKQIAKAVQDNKLAISVLHGEYEKSIDWSIGPRACSSHLDCLGDSYITDLKVTNCTEPGRFELQAERMAWHAQLAWYRRAGQGLRGAGGPYWSPDLYLVGVEPTAPYPVTVIRVGESAAHQGDLLCRSWFERVIECESSGIWPGYTDQVFDMTLRNKGESNEL